MGRGYGYGVRTQSGFLAGGRNAGYSRQAPARLKLQTGALPKENQKQIPKEPPNYLVYELADRILRREHVAISVYDRIPANVKQLHEFKHIYASIVAKVAYKFSGFGMDNQKQKEDISQLELGLKTVLHDRGSDLMTKYLLHSRNIRRAETDRRAQRNMDAEINARDAALLSLAELCYRLELAETGAAEDATAYNKLPEEQQQRYRKTVQKVLDALETGQSMLPSNQFMAPRYMATDLSLAVHNLKQDLLSKSSKIA